MTINTLLEAGPHFDLSGPDSTKLVTKHFNQAKKLLAITDKKDIERLKNKDSGLIKTERGEDLLTAINILARAGHRVGANYGDEKRDSANEILGKLETGFPDNKKELKNDPLYKESKKAFDDKYERHNPGSKEEKETVEPAAEIAQKKVEKGAPAAEIAQNAEPDDDVTADDDEPEAKTEAPREEPTSSAPKSVEGIQNLKAQTVDNIQKKLDALKDDLSVGGKIRYSNTQKVLKGYQKDMDRLIEKAKAGPRNAGAAFNKADSTSRLADVSSVKAGLKGAVGRTIMKGQEMGASLKQAAKKGAENVSKALDSEAAEKIRQTVGKAKERIKPAVEKGVAAVGEKIAKTAETKPIKAAIEKVKSKTADVAGKAKQTAEKVLGNVKAGAEKVVDTAKEKLKKKPVPEVKGEPGITKPSSQEELTPAEEKAEQEKERVRRLAASAKRKAMIKKIPGVKRIS